MEARKHPSLKNYQFITANGIPCNLGFGAYGSVQLGKSLKNGQTVAIKKIGRKIALGEVEIHMKLNHPNIIKMLDYQIDQKNESTYIILEYAENGTLFQYIRDHGLKDKTMIKGIFQSVCDAIEYMHSKNIMHRDIKPQNILLAYKNVVKLCDFGFAAYCEPRMTLCGTVQYMAPEMILRKPYNHKIDIWGLGILLFEMIEGRAPFEGHTQQEVLDKMKKPIFFSKTFTANQIDLIHRILKVDPNERPQIKQICRSACLRSSHKSGDDNGSKRSTFEQKKTISSNDEKRSTFEDEKEREKEKKIKIIEIIDISGGHKEKSEKKNSYDIKITSIRDIGPNENVQVSSFNSLPVKGDKLEKPISAGSLSSPGNTTILPKEMPAKQKISLKKKLN